MRTLVSGFNARWEFRYIYLSVFNTYYCSFQRLCKFPMNSKTLILISAGLIFNFHNITLENTLYLYFIICKCLGKTPSSSPYTCFLYENELLPLARWVYPFSLYCFKHLIHLGLIYDFAFIDLLNAIMTTAKLNKCYKNKYFLINIFSALCWPSYWWGAGW